MICAKMQMKLTNYGKKEGEKLRGLKKIIKDFVKILKKQKIQYAVVGGIAVSTWGNIRTTRDIDIIILIKIEEIHSFVDELRKNNFSTSKEDFILGMKENTHITVFDNLSEYQIDILIANKENHFLTLENSVAIDFFGIKINFASPEDTIANKLLFGSEQDVKDAIGIYIRQGENLNNEYLIKICKKLNVYKKFLAMKRKFSKLTKSYF